MPHDPYRALYLHLPFCVKRCAYCDFATAAVPADSPEIDAYVEDLCLQIRRKAKEGELGAVETVYLGGGTPSHVGLARLSMLLYTLSLSMHLTPEVECTMEANPESLDGRMVRDVWALGVNRLSLGVQSFDDAVLRTLGRAHTADDARRAVEAAQTRFENVSVDVMCGIPGQSEASFEESVREAVRLGVTHVSVYPLTIEPHTPFDAAVLAGGCPLRQLILAGQGSSDSAMTVIGMFIGAALAHNFGLAASGTALNAETQEVVAGAVPFYGKAAVIICIAVCFIIAFTNKRSEGK